MKLIITGGGTGGHVTPALALIDEAKRERYPLNAIYVCRKDGDENRPIRALGIKQYEIEVEGLSRKISATQIRAFGKFLKAFRETKKMLKEENPDAVFATGGYVSAPVLLAAKSCKVPCFLHESNSIPGLVTKLFAPSATRVFLTTSSAGSKLNAKKMSTVGCPIRGDFGKIKRSQARHEIGVAENDFLIIAFGGSLGAKRINEAVYEAAGKIEKENVRIILGVGRRYYEEELKKAGDRGKRENLTVLPYIDNMATMLAAADLAICRCGAVTLAELKASLTPAILIPSPNVTEDHQTENAKSAVKEGCAVMLPESDLTGDALAKLIKRFTEKPMMLEAMREAEKQTARNNAAKEILTQIRIDLNDSIS